MEKKPWGVLTGQIKPYLKFVILLLGIGILAPVSAFGYEFSDVRNSLVRDLEKWQGYASRNKIAIVFNNENRERVKQSYNLVSLKKDLSHELLKSFDVSDPIIVQEIIKSNKLKYRQIAHSKSVLGQFADRANSVHVLLVDLQPNSQTLVANFKLMNRDYATISTIVTEIAPESKDQVTYTSNEKDNDSSASEFSVADSLNSTFGPREFEEGQNDSWIYFSPTALLNPETHALHLALWFKDAGKVDVQAVRFRYSLKLLELLQLGVQTYAITERASSEADEPNSSKETGLHSAYASLKFLIVDDTVLPVNLAIGVRRRVYWDKDNNDFRYRDQINKVNEPEEYDDAKDLDEKNNRFNRLTLQAMVTGKLDIGLLYNVYVDSQTVVTGAKFLLTPNIKVFADNVYYYFKEPDVLSDLATGIQFYNLYGSADIMYQFETRQIQLGLNLDF